MLLSWLQHVFYFFPLMPMTSISWLCPTQDYTCWACLMISIMHAITLYRSVCPTGPWTLSGEGRIWAYEVPLPFIYGRHRLVWKCFSNLRGKNDFKCFISQRHLLGKPHHRVKWMPSIVPIWLRTTTWYQLVLLILCLVSLYYGKKVLPVKGLC